MLSTPLRIFCWLSGEGVWAAKERIKSYGGCLFPYVASVIVHKDSGTDKGTEPGAYS